MIKIQIAYKADVNNKELSFAYMKGETIIEALQAFNIVFPGVTVYCIIVCGRL